jgi:hypothetical protein
MKQAEDKLTADMFGQPDTKPTYRFYITTENNETLAWSNLTLRQAEAMNKLMSKFNPLQSNVHYRRYGWEEVQ